MEATNSLRNEHWCTERIGAGSSRKSEVVALIRVEKGFGTKNKNTIIAIDRVIND